MEIQGTLTRKKVSIVDVELGGSFIFDDDLHIRIYDPDYSNIRYPNAILNVRTSRVIRLPDICFVTPVSAKIVIGEE